MTTEREKATREMDRMPRPDSMAGDVPSKASRPPAYDLRPERYQWHFGAIPRCIRSGGRTIPSPFRERALFVVHGIGEQELTQTAATLRLGLEDALIAVDPKHWAPQGPDNWIVPQPYIADGYWGNYHEITRMESETWAQMTENERVFFRLVWGHRAISASSTYWWFLRTSVRLIGRSHGLARLYYLYLVPMLQLVTSLALLHPRLRQFVRGYLNDARLYLEPQGDVAHVIVQRIDHVVGAKFLQLLGFDWDLKQLPEDHQLFISGEPHEFRRVAWVAHSLGTVISYNVIGDLLRRCLAVDTKDADQLRNAKVVTESIEAFITLGSPLDKIRFLFPAALRDWPPEYLPGGPRSLWTRKDRPPSFWQNFHYTSDPVSGRLDGFTRKGQTMVANIHPKGVHFPGLSHLTYWSDRPLLARLLSITFGEYVDTPSLRTRSPLHQQASLILGAFFLALPGLAAVWWFWKMLLGH